MSALAIRVHDLSKSYRLSGEREGYQTLRDTIMEVAASPLRTARARLAGARRRRTSSSGETIWALDGLCFDVRHGDVVGVIGRNGAGKSTLLKILSRITDPSRGYADIHGRVGSLLEVGTGFHPELTGRENVYLNGAIIGMKKAEIERNFDEIVAFAEVEKFIDTPVKRYSSGMYLRLAFSVAAHLEPEILLVDEVLAVGDLAFQRKCLGKMRDTAATGRTVLFVSHNLGAVKELCQTCVVLKGGRLDFSGKVVDGLARYSQDLASEEEGSGGRGTGWRRLTINEQHGEVAPSVSGGDPLIVEATLDLREEFSGGRLFCIINNSLGDVVVHQRMYLRDLAPEGLPAGTHDLRIELPALWLAPGIYTLYFKFIGSKRSGAEERHFSERVIIDMQGSTSGVGRAALAPPLRWSLSSVEAEPEMATGVGMPLGA